MTLTKTQKMKEHEFIAASCDCGFQLKGNPYQTDRELIDLVQLHMKNQHPTIKFRVTKFTPRKEIN